MYILTARGNLMGKRKVGGGPAPEMFGVLVYLPKSTVVEVDRAVARRRGPVPRTVWLREAVYEKLEREGAPAIDIPKAMASRSRP